MAPIIRMARDAEFDALPALEQAADAVFASIGIDPVFAPATAEQYRHSLAVLVASDPAVGLARLEELDGQAHLEQLAVHPSCAGRGLGRALVEAVCGWAVEHGYGSITLVTYRHVAWNAPFYATCGFVETNQLSPELEACWRHDAEGRPARFGPRLVMRRQLVGPL